MYFHHDQRQRLDQLGGAIQLQLLGIQGQLQEVRHKHFPGQVRLEPDALLFHLLHLLRAEVRGNCSVS